mgnify:CR=1 FL=1
MANSGATRHHRRRVWWTVLAVISSFPVIQTGSRPAEAAVPVPQFAAGVEYSLGINASSMAIADFTGDGRKDVIANPGWSPTGGYKLQLATQQPDGSFQASQLDMVPWSQNYQTVLAAGDIDGDGRADVAVPTDHGVKVVLQRNGTLGPALDTALPGTRRVLLADLDSDGRLDLVASGTSGVAWLRGNGDGTFGVPTSISAVAHMRVEVGHFNRDSRPDVVGLYQGMYVFRQREDGTFDTRQMTGFGLELTVGDLTGDGLDDIAAASGTSVAVWPQRQDGTLAPAVFYPARDDLRAIVIGDVNGDGRKDAVTARLGGRETGVMPQDTDGTLTPERRFSTPYEGIGDDQLFVDDVSGDGRPDLVVLSGVGFGVLRGLAPPTGPDNFVHHLHEHTWPNDDNLDHGARTSRPGRGHLLADGCRPQWCIQRRSAATSAGRAVGPRPRRNRLVSVDRRRTGLRPGQDRPRVPRFNPLRTGRGDGPGPLGADRPGKQSPFRLWRRPGLRGQ